MFNCHSHTITSNCKTILNNDLEWIEGLFYSIGRHPWEVINSDDNFLKIQQNASKKNCLAIGEIGLDRLKGPDLAVQKLVFERQIRISEEEKLPVIIHCVKAWNEIAEIKERMNPKQTWIYHGFNKVGILENVLKLGLMISIGAAVLTNSKLQGVISQIPDDRLLLETDDAPIDIFEIYKKVSEIKKIPLQSLERIIEENFKRTFKKWQSGSNVQNY